MDNINEHFIYGRDNQLTLEERQQIRREREQNPWMALNGRRAGQQPIFHDPPPIEESIRRSSARLENFQLNRRLEEENRRLLAENERLNRLTASENARTETDGIVPTVSPGLFRGVETDVVPSIPTPEQGRRFDDIPNEQRLFTLTPQETDVFPPTPPRQGFFGPFIPEQGRQPSRVSTIPLQDRFPRFVLHPQQRRETDVVPRQGFFGSRLPEQDRPSIFAPLPEQGRRPLFALPQNNNRINAIPSPRRGQIGGTHRRYYKKNKKTRRGIN